MCIPLANGPTTGTHAERDPASRQAPPLDAFMAQDVHFEDDMTAKTAMVAVLLFLRR